MITNEETKVCQTCEGTGEVWESSQVYKGEPHMADQDTTRCPDCNMSDYMDDEDNEE